MEKSIVLPRRQPPAGRAACGNVQVPSLLLGSVGWLGNAQSPVLPEGIVVTRKLHLILTAGNWKPQQVQGVQPASSSSSDHSLLIVASDHQASRTHLPGQLSQLGAGRGGASSWNSTGNWAMADLEWEERGGEGSAGNGFRRSLRHTAAALTPDLFAGFPYKLSRFEVMFRSLFQVSNIPLQLRHEAITELPHPERRLTRSYNTAS